MGLSGGTEAGPAAFSRASDSSLKATYSSPIAISIDNRLECWVNPVRGNIAHGNSGADLNDTNPGCDSNTWKGNNFDEATGAGGPNPACIG